MAKTVIIHGRRPPPHSDPEYVPWLERELELRTQPARGTLIQVTEGSYKGMLVYVDSAEEWGVDGRNFYGVPQRVAAGSFVVIGPVPMDPFRKNGGSDEQVDVGV